MDTGKNSAGSMNLHLFPRNFRKSYPAAVRGQGCYLFMADGRRLLDASGGAAVVTIGHGVSGIADAMAQQAARLAHVHSSQFLSEPAEELAAELLAMAPPNFRDGGRVYFTSGGSEAVETALKLARQYFVERGEPSRFRVIARRQSYHGATLGALAVSGNERRKQMYAPMLPEWGRIAPCYCYRCPFGLRYPECQVACAEELETAVQDEGNAKSASDVAAFIAEPIAGATLGAAVPPPRYWPRIAEICGRHGILLIADEVMTGMGRTGRPFALNHWGAQPDGIQPDLIVLGKGLASGYAPLGAVLVSKNIAETIAHGSGSFLHGFTYTAHPVTTAVGLAVLRYARSRGLVERVADTGAELMQALEPLRRHPGVGDIRGMGLLTGIEWVRDAGTREPWPAEVRFADRIYEAALETWPRGAADMNGVVTYPIQGCVDGWRGDITLLAPPYIINSTEIGELTAALHAAVVRVTAELRKQGVA
jgi:adenosylmethionine-8-amino-7-oxononanoate aminotransferase